MIRRRVTAPRARLRVRAFRPLPVVLGCVALSAPAFSVAQSGTTVVPTLSVSQTFTDNRRLSATDPQADSITQISPGVVISSRTGRLQGSLSYAANAVIYA